MFTGCRVQDMRCPIGKTKIQGVTKELALKSVSRVSLSKGRALMKEEDA